MQDELGVKYWEVAWSKVTLPCSIKPDMIRDLHNIFKKYLPFGTEMKFIEIGCAPGGWLSYFHKSFGYKVTGIDYAKDAVEITKRNMKIQNIKADIFYKDFFDYKPKDKFDIAFSGGFIEHFLDTELVVEKLADLVKKGGYIVTIIPNLYGVGGIFSKIFRPKVYRGHVKFDKSKFKQFHERCKFNTLYCDYYGGINVGVPIDKNWVAMNLPLVRCVLNLPFTIFNKLIAYFSSKFMFYPRNSAFSPSLVYIGRKPM